MTLDLAALSIDPEPIDVYHALLDAGRTLASIAELDLDIGDYVREIGTIEQSLDRIASDLFAAESASWWRMYGEPDEPRAVSYADAAKQRAEDTAAARAAAVRACKRQLIALARVINEMETRA